MKKKLTKIYTSLTAVGFVATVKKIFKVILKPYRVRNFKRNILTLNDSKNKFIAIYESNYWNNDESVSGAGSTLEVTRNLRKKLPELFSRFSTQSILDAPCGDFNWMRSVVEETNISYIGGDIVPMLVKSNNAKYKKDNTSFLHLDLTKDKFPSVDLMICRDCLFHLSFSDIKLVLENFIASKTTYLLTTTYVNKKRFENKDIVTGDFRLIDLFTSPFNFPTGVLYRIEDWIEPEPEREMCLWTREQVLLSLTQFEC